MGLNSLIGNFKYKKPTLDEALSDKSYGVVTCAIIGGVAGMVYATNRNAGKIVSVTTGVLIGAAISYYFVHYKNKQS